MEPKKTYFAIDITIPNERIHSESFLKQLDDNIDLILYSMGASTSDTDIHKIVKVDGTKCIVLFKALTRKRKGQLTKYCTRHLNDVSFQALAIDKDKVLTYLSQAKNNPSYRIIEESNSDHYDGSDIKIFHNKKNWYPWQTDIYNMIYNEDGSIKEPDPRSIISIVDYKGASGKSSFFKFLYTQDESKSIGRAGYGTAQQLRSAIIGQGPKKIYIIDLSRAKSKYDNQEDLLSILEDCKSGFIISPMYGQIKELVMNPPHIIVCSNYLFNTELLSQDRWNVYEIKDNKLGKKNELLIKTKRKEVFRERKNSVKKHLEIF